MPAAARGHSLTSNVYVTAFLAYLVFSIADSCIKAVGPRVGVVEISFAMSLVAAVTVVLFSGRDQGWTGFWRTPQPLRVHGRAICGVISGLGSSFAFTTVPLVEAVAVLFLAPFFVTVLSRIVLREQVGPWRWTAVAIGFAGVLLAVRPGFATVEPGHLAALAAGMATGTAIVIMRSLHPDVRRSSVLGMLFAYSLAVKFTLLALLGYAVPGAGDMLILVIAGVCAGLGQISLLAATRAGSASQVAPFAYTQLGWAIVFGAAIFGEIPDALAICGICCIVAAGLMTVFRDRLQRLRLQSQR
jgi:drug/metabolite transporter (DMT)-like permease